MDPAFLHQSVLPYSPGGKGSHNHKFRICIVLSETYVKIIFYLCYKENKSQILEHLISPYWAIESMAIPQKQMDFMAP